MRQVLTHRVNYTAKAVPLQDVIDSLIAQQKLLQEGVAVLGRAAPDSELQLVGIRVNNIKDGSLIIDLGLELYHAYQTSVDDKVIKGIEALTGTDVPAEYESIVTLAALAVTYWVAKWAYDSVRAKLKKENPTVKQGPSIHIEGNYNHVVTLISDRLNISESTFQKALADEITPKKRKQLLGKVTDFLRPAKQEPGSKIELAGAGEIDAATLEEYPNEADLHGLEETTVLPIPDARLEIRALDRDSLKSGWKAKIIGNPAFPNKLPMDLYPTINAEKLADYKTISGNIAVEFMRERGGTLRPKRIHLLEFKDGEE